MNSREGPARTPRGLGAGGAGGRGSDGRTTPPGAEHARCPLQTGGGHTEGARVTRGREVGGRPHGPKVTPSVASVLPALESG